MTSCLVKVIHTTEFSQMVQDPLKTSFQGLFNYGTHSDIMLQINEEIPIPLHKCILAGRSPKFNGMFSSNIIETNQKLVKVEQKNLIYIKLCYNGYIVGTGRKYFRFLVRVVSRRDRRHL
ncbi:unnamed protein product [Paramecium sonneborni]|uniref:BTB domain-containing protein n=1 Tax=Paramecium sonneborni TaxID=65129 RepID=A0A8S1PFC6_9CILI|nr:unnamed protein product [Paramecium sonneborni]